MSGRCTLSATTRPSRRTARCTCEIEAEATGFSSSEAKIFASGRPYSSVKIASTCSNGNVANIVPQKRELVRVGLGQADRAAC